MPNSLKLAVLGTFLSATVVAQQAPVLQPIGPEKLASTVAGRSGAGAQSLITGKAVDVNSAPLPNATVRLRNLTSNEIEQVSTSNAIGEFTFIARPDIPYIVEIADQAGRILAVGDVIVAQAGDVAATLVAIPSKIPAIAGVFGESMGSVVSAAAGTGVTVVETALLPLVSPER